MTIAEAIASCDAQQPNCYSAAEKRRWLSELDGQLYDCLLYTALLTGYQGTDALANLPGSRNKPTHATDTHPRGGSLGRDLPP